LERGRRLLSSWESQLLFLVHDNVFDTCLRPFRVNADCRFAEPFGETVCMSQDDAA
jgi:hypothetical protein